MPITRKILRPPSKFNSSQNHKRYETPSQINKMVKEEVKEIVHDIKADEKKKEEEEKETKTKRIL